MDDDKFELSETNFIYYAAKHYETRGYFDEVEFHDDMKRFKYIKRLFNRYKETGNIKERLILNHIVILSNVFTPQISVKMLFFKFDGYYPILKPFLILLNILPDTLVLNDRTIDTRVIQMDEKIIEVLRKV